MIRQILVQQGPTSEGHISPQKVRPDSKAQQLLCRFVYGPSFWTTFCPLISLYGSKSKARSSKIKCGARKWSANLVSKWICFLGLLCGSQFGVKIVPPNWGRIVLYITQMIVRVFVWLSTT